MEKNIEAMPTPMIEPAMSIEEPKTLTFSQLALLREAALKVINSNTPEEATITFMGKAETSSGVAIKEAEYAAKANK